MPREILNTPEDIIEALGGVSALAKLFGLDRRNVFNWKVRGFPPESYYALSLLLKRRGYAAPPSLWRQYELVE